MVHVSSTTNDYDLLQTLAFGYSPALPLYFWSTFPPKYLDLLPVSCWIQRSSSTSLFATSWRLSFALRKSSRLFISRTLWSFATSLLTINVQDPLWASEFWQSYTSLNWKLLENNFSRLPDLLPPVSPDDGRSHLATGLRRVLTPVHT